MKKIEWKKYLYKAVIVILIVFFIGGVGIGAANILSIEGTKELYTPAESLVAYPETPEKTIEYINGAVEKALELRPRTVLSESFSIDKDTVCNPLDNVQIVAAAKKAAVGIENQVKDGFGSATADYSESASSFLKTVDVSAADIESVNIDFEYYRCSMCTSKVSPEDFAEVCPECGNVNTLEKRCSDVYKITVHLKPGCVSVENNGFPVNENLSDILSEGGADFYKLEKLDKIQKSAVLYAEINRLTYKLNYLRFETVFDMDAFLDFSAAYPEIGRTDISFSAKDRYNYSFTWPGVSLNSSEMTVELGSTEVLKATLTCDNPVEYDVSWSSDNEDILSVDDEGYLKTHKKYGDATITAAFTFKGQQYTDSCLVHVGVPCEGVDLNKGKLTLAEGESYQIVAEFDPKDTTNTVCFWFSEDESVAAIDDSGLVTAVGNGITTVYVVTDDGNFYSSCEVKVTD